MPLQFNKFYKFSPYLTILIGFLVSFLVGLFSYQYYQKQEQANLELKSYETVLLIKARMILYEQALKRGVNLFNTSDCVSRNQWEIFFKEQKLYENLKGIQGFGYCEVVLPDNKEEHEQRIKKEGFNDYKIYPQGQRELYTSIIYFEPFDEANKKTFGYDMFSEKIRHKAMKIAMQTAEATLSAKITVVEEFDEEIWPAFFMYVPVYKKASKHTTPQDRTLHIQGFVYAPFHVDQLMDGILGTMFSKMGFEVYDGNSTHIDNLLYSSNATHTYKLHKKINIEVNGRIWTLVFRTKSVLQSENIYIIFLMSSLVLILTLLLYLLLQSLIKAKEYALQTTQKLQTSEERLRFALEGPGDGLWDWNLKTDEIFYSKRWKEMIGYEEHEIPHNLDGWKSRVHPQDIKQALQDIAKHVEGKSDTYKNEHRLRCKDGSYKWILSRGLIVSHDVDGTPLRMVGSHNDISLRKEMEKELQMYTHELETKIATEVERNRLQQEKVFNQARHAQMGEMIGMIAHQWRQPLNAVSGAAVNLGLKQRFGMLKDEDIEEASRFIQKSAQQMSQTIDDFMNFFKSNSQKELFSITEVINNIKHMMNAQLNTLGIDMQTIVDDSLQVHGNKNELTHILLNLIINSRDALKTQTGKAKKISIHACLESDTNCSIEVVDNGGGIDIAIIDKIFNPYFTTKEQGQGIGIGLHMAKEIIERNFNGNISIKNTDDGVAFTLNISI